MEVIEIPGHLPKEVSVNEETGKLSINLTRISVARAEHILNETITGFIEPATKKVLQTSQEMRESITRERDFYYHLHFVALFLAALFFVMWLFK